MQDTQDWLKLDDCKGADDQTEDSPATPEKQGGITWGEAKADASWNSPEQEQPELSHDYGCNNVFDDDSFQVVSKKKRKGKNAARSGNVPRGRGPRRN